MDTTNQSDSGQSSDSHGLVPNLENCSPDEMGRLLELFRPYLLVIANSEFPPMLASKLGPSDLVQLTLAKGYGAFPTFRGSTREELAHWLRSILLNFLKTEVRSHQQQVRAIVRERPVADDLAHPQQMTASDIVVSREQHQRVASAMNRLSEQYRRAIELRHIDNLSFAEIGRRLDRSEESARKLWGRAVRQLQQELADDAHR